MFFDDWSGLIRVAVMGTCAYAALIVLLRVSGKRTLAKLNAFDFVVTVAIGSTLATVLLSSSVALAEGVLALALLVGLQFVVAWASVRSRRVERFVKSEPRLVYRDGFLPDAMHRERVTADELYQSARRQGHADLAPVTAMVLETDGTLTVLTETPSSLLPPPDGSANGEGSDGRAWQGG
jgi:uncharacterized membrane protein YcaP (DUF421 family)